MGIPGTVPPILCYMYNPENSVQSHGTYILPIGLSGSLMANLDMTGTCMCSVCVCACGDTKRSLRMRRAV